VGLQNPLSRRGLDDWGGQRLAELELTKKGACTVSKKKPGLKGGAFAHMRGFLGWRGAAGGKNQVSWKLKREGPAHWNAQGKDASLSSGKGGRSQVGSVP